MSRLLLQTAAFVREARRLVKKNPQAAPNLQAALETLADDAFHPALKTHKLKGELAGSWACSSTCRMRSWKNTQRGQSNVRNASRTISPS
jgi:mRNA interferase YafQ